MPLSGLQLTGWLLYLASLGWILYQLPLKHLLANNKTQHLVFGSAAAVFFLWLFRTQVQDGPPIHFLWLTALCLTLGFRRAMFAGALSLLGVTALGMESWQMFGINGVLTVSLPLAVSYLIYSLGFHYLPRHFFVYIFLCAFIPGGLMIALKMFALSSYYTLDGIYSWQYVQDNYLIVSLLMLFPEAMLNGMTMTLLILYKPNWVYTFYDKFYLHGK